MRLSGSKASNLRQQRQLLAAATVVIGLICIGFIWLALAGGPIADDYIEKPFSPSVLVARVKADLSQFERAAGHKKPLNEIRIGNISINTSTRYVFSGGREVF